VKTGGYNWEPTDLSWAAGFFDGEGSVGCILSHNRPSIRIHISQKDTRVLDKWHRIFPVGSFHCRQNGNGRGITDIAIGNFENVQAIMCAMWPWLGERKKEDYTRAMKKYLKHHKYTWQYRYRGTKQKMFK
jgi:hypothetical protein